MDFVKGGDISNVTFYGRYLKKDEPKYLHGVSLINILKEDDINSMMLMSNRLYLSLVHGIPMIVNKDCEQGRLAGQCNLGVVVDKSLDVKKQ